MKILIVYDSVSPSKNTEKIAHVISETLKEKGFDTTIALVGTVDKGSLRNYDCLLVGSPTMGWSATKPIKELLESFKPNEFTGKLGAAFDTRIESRLSGSASKGIEDRLKKLGFKIIAKPFFAYVEGSGSKNDYSLKEGQIEKAKTYAENLTKSIQ